MDSHHTVAIHIEGQDRLSPLLKELARANEHLIQTARLSGDVLSDMAGSLEENARAAKLMLPDTRSLAGATQLAADAYRRQTDAARESAASGLRAAEAGRQAAQAQMEQAKNLSEQVPALLQKVIDASEAYRKNANVIGETLKEGFNNFRKETANGLENLFSVVFKGKLDNFKPVWEKFTGEMENAFFKMLGRIAAGMTQELLLKPALELGEKALSVAGSTLKALFMAEGGLVTKPTLALIGEAGPEVVLPLEAAGEFVKKTLVGAAKETALNEAAKQAALDAGLEIGAERAAAAAAAAAGLTTGAALFVFGDAINAALGGQSAIRAIGDIAFGERGKQGLIEKGLGELGLPAFRKRGGEFNLPMIQALYAEALAAPPVPPFGFNELMARLGSDDPGRARAFLAPYLGEGGFVTGPTLALLGEAGREAVLPLDSPLSIRALQEGLRPIVREAFAEKRRGAPGAIVFERGAFDLRGAFFPDGRSIEQLARLIEEKLRRLPRTGRGGYSGV